MEIDEINSTESTRNSLIDHNNVIKSLLFRRYLLRMRQIRARRKIIQKLQQFKYLQYQQASEKLFTLFSMRLLNLYKLHNKEITKNKISNFAKCKSKKIFIRKLPNRNCKNKKKNNISRPQYWWKNIFPNLSDNEFYYTFHLQREIYKNLCEQLQHKLMIQQNYGNGSGNNNNDSTSVEKQVALCLFKLAHGYSYRKTGAIFGLHYATVHKLFSRFVRELINLYSNNISQLEYNECFEMNQNAINKIDITTPQIIGTLMRVKFTSSSELILYAHGIIDVDEKFHFVRIVKDANDHSFYAELDDACKKYYPNKGCYNYKESEMYLVVTDQIVPDYDCFLNKSILESNDNDNENNDDKSYIQKKVELLYSANVMLKCEENAISKLVERWNILAYHLDFTSKLLSSVVETCIILHNICQDYLIKNNMNFQSFNDINIDNKFKNDKIIDITSDTENKEENNYDDDDDDDDDEVEEENNKNNNQIDDDEDDDNIDDDDENYEIDDDNDNINADLRDDDVENNLNRHFNEIMETEILSNSYYNDDDQNKNNEEEENYRENYHHNKNDKNDRQIKSKENDCQIKSKENDCQNKNKENDRQNNKENDLQNKNQENDHQNDKNDRQIKNKENDCQNNNKENDFQIKSKENDRQNNKENDLQNKNQENDHQNENDKNDRQIKNAENDRQIKNKENDCQNNNKENDFQIKSKENDLQNKNKENNLQNKNAENDRQIKNKENDRQNKNDENDHQNKNKNDLQIKNDKCNDDIEVIEINVHNNDNNDDEQINKNINSDYGNCIIKTECNENEKIEIIVQQDNEKSNKNIHSNNNNMNDMKNEKVLNTDDDNDDDDELSFDKFVVQSVSDDTDVEDYDEDHSVYFYGDDNE